MTDNEWGDLKSKSQLKRDRHALQELGRILIDLPERLLKRLPLPESLVDAIHTGRRLQRGALQRHIRHLGGLLDDADHVAIQAALDLAQTPRHAEVKTLHEIETLRDALLSDVDNGMRLLTARYPLADREKVRGLVSDALRERAAARPPQAARALFKLIAQLSGAETASTVAR
ncbi:MAG: DUF615 domain-containing protein [Gammaproteobacteria bacterium]|nr:DUF615 domain-containing protein [Gammaproteobacteria bacterium]